MTKPIGFDNWLSHNFISSDGSGKDFYTLGSFCLEDSGKFRVYRGPSIASTSAASACVVTTTEAHGLKTGQTVRFAQLPAAISSIMSGDLVVTVLTTATFSVPVTTTSAGATTGLGIVGVDIGQSVSSSAFAYTPGMNCMDSVPDPWMRPWAG